MQEQEAQSGIFAASWKNTQTSSGWYSASSSRYWCFCTESRRRFYCGAFPQERIPADSEALLDIAGWVELISALLIGFGILTRLGAGAICVTMIVAYFGIHARLSPVWPWPHLYPDPGGFAAHGGEVTILWFIVAGIIGVIGGGKYALDRTIFKKEML